MKDNFESELEALEELSKEGGAAFPLETEQYYHFGMSQRDYIATHALAGMLAHSTRYVPRPGAPTNWHEAISQEAYQLADAMLAERKKGVR